MGDAFGRARSAAGFDVDLSAISRLTQAEPIQSTGIFVSAQDAAQAWDDVQALRANNERVVVGIPGQERAYDHQGCDRGVSALI